eukprot:m.46077 g.46077  ORF g.46077 m.46077 type:complete len:255 (-) comp10707_c1_seq3:796-1560(-)
MSDTPTFVPNIPTKKVKKKKKKKKLSETIKAKEDKAKTPKEKKHEKKKPQQPRKDKYQQQDGGVFSQLSAPRKGSSSFSMANALSIGSRSKVAGTPISGSKSIGSSTGGKKKQLQQQQQHLSVNDVNEFDEIEMEERPFSGEWMHDTEDRLKPILLPLESLKINDGGKKIKLEEEEEEAKAMDIGDDKEEADEKPLYSMFMGDSNDISLFQLPSLLPYSTMNIEVCLHIRMYCIGLYWMCDYCFLLLFWMVVLK